MIIRSPYTSHYIYLRGTISYTLSSSFHFLFHYPTIYPLFYLRRAIRGRCCRPAAGGCSLWRHRWQHRQGHKAVARLVRLRGNGCNVNARDECSQYLLACSRKRQCVIWVDFIHSLLQTRKPRNA